MLPCTPVAKANRMAAFSFAKCGHTSRRSMTFCTTRQTLPSAVRRALAIMPLTCASFGRPIDSKGGLAAATTCCSSAGSSSCLQAASRTAKSPVAATASRTKPMSSGITSSTCNMEATCTKRTAARTFVGNQCAARPVSVAAEPSASVARRPSSARNTEQGQPAGIKTCTTGACSPAEVVGRRQSMESAETTYGIRAATLLVSSIISAPLLSAVTRLPLSSSSAHPAAGEV
mmetsp:Transcript_112244/g.198875  ORF Transcript_112244/g.198875 Transcript_112244/m.198875 type:complete len:231 (+) Transcript_112244:662-1354(+)